MWRRGGPVRVVTVRTKYRAAAPSPATDTTNGTTAEASTPVIVTTPVPPQILPNASTRSPSVAGRNYCGRKSPTAAVRQFVSSGAR